MTTTATDNFDRADETPIASPWAAQTGVDAMRLISNEVLTNISANESAAYHSIVPPNDQWSQAVLSTLETSTADIQYGLGPAVRMQTGDSRKYRACCRTGQILLLLWDNVGGRTQLGSTFSGTVSVGDLIYLEAVGTIIRVLQNGVERINVTDATLSSGRFGMGGTYSNITAAALDTWKGGDFSIAAARAAFGFAPQHRMA